MKKKKSKKKKSINEILNNHKTLIIVVAIILIILIAFFMVSKEIINEDEEENEFNIGKPDILTPKLSPLELSQQKEDYEGETITILGAYIPSEAFIYVQEANDKIYLKPANKDYCRNYDLTGTLKYNYIVSQWEFYPENYDNCLD